MYNLIKQTYHSLLYTYEKRRSNFKLSAGIETSCETVVLIDRLEARSGGVRNIARITKALSSDKFGKIIIVINKKSKGDGEIYLNYGFSGNPTYSLPKSFKNLITTSWTQVQAVSLEHEIRKFSWYHIIQDFDDLFFPISTRNYFARFAKTDPDRFIVSGKWMRFEKQAVNLPFPVDSSVYFNRNKLKKFDVIIFHKPEMPRRCAYLMELIAKKLIELDPSLNIAFHGSLITKWLVRDNRFRYIGTPNTLNELADFYSSAKIGISVSSTNPSLIPFEQAAAGCLPMAPGYFSDNIFYLPLIHGSDKILDFCKAVQKKLISDSLEADCEKVIDFYMKNEYICDMDDFEEIIANNLN